MTTVVERLQQQRAADPNKLMCIVRDRAYTRAEVDDMSSRVAANLLAAGLAPGDRIGVHLSNSIETIATYFACFKAGFIAVPVNTRFKANEIEYVLRHSEARAYIGQADLYVEAVSAMPQITRRYLAGDGAQGVAGFNSLMTTADASRTFPPVPFDQPAMILYTSGTTARPKGVTHTHRTIAAMAICTADAFGGTDDRPMVVLPMMHIAACCGFFAAVWKEWVPVVLPFDPNAILDAAEKHRATILSVMPALLRMILDAQIAKPRDTSSIRAVAIGGDSAPAVLHEQSVTTIGAPLLEIYGLTEAVPASCNVPERIRPGSLGLPAPGIEWRIIDDEGREVAPGEVGQVTLRGALMMTGYWNDPAATAATIKDGWLHTGDLARQDEAGFYWFAGRSKEIIIRGGSNVSPQEVEETLYQHPAVAEVAVVGKPDERWGETIVAFIALKAGMSLTADELTAFASERIAKYKVPEAIYFEPTLPKGPTGKVARRPLRERLLVTA